MAASPPPRPTLAKVALLAHVSTATASNALAGKGRVSEETVARVLAAARRIGYRTNTGARALSMGRTTAVGVLVGTSVDAMIRDRQSFFWIRLLDAFVTRCSQVEVTTTIVNEGQAQTMIDSGIDVLVLLGAQNAEAVADLEIPFGLPVLSPETYGEIEENVPAHDVGAIAAEVMAEFGRLGRSTVAWLPGPWGGVVGEWQEALASAAEQRGMTVTELHHDDSLESLTQAFSAPAGQEADAVFGLFRNPRFLVEALRANGRRVPGDVAVVIQSEGILEEVTTPTLSTLSLCGAQCGDRLADLAVALGRGERAAPGVLPFELVRRESTIR